MLYERRLPAEAALKELSVLTMQKSHFYLKVHPNHLGEHAPRPPRGCTHVWTLQSTFNPPNLNFLYPPLLFLSANAVTLCLAKREGLVHYPTTLAPVSGSMSVTAKCADNAHRTSSSLSVTCTSSGNWSGAGAVLQCECDTGYYAVTESEREQTCQCT